MRTMRPVALLSLCLVLSLFTVTAFGPAKAASESAKTSTNVAAHAPVATPKVKEVLNIAHTEQTIRGSVEDIQWICPDQKTVVVLSSEKVVYISKDEGKTWQDQTPKYHGAITSTVKGSKPDSITPPWDEPAVSIKKIVVSKADPKVVFLTSTGTTHFMTCDCGLTWSAVYTAQVNFDNVILHPKDKKMILASAMTKDCSDSDSAGACFRNLYISKDHGKTWTYLMNYVVQFDWVHSLARDQAKGLPMDGIVATVFRTKSGNQKFGYWDRDIDFVYTEDLFKTVNVEIRHGNRFLFTDKFLFVAAAHPEENGQVNLFLSSNGGQAFTQVKMPYQIRQHSYTILDTSEDQVFLHVNHEGDGAAWGNVYISDAIGQRYSLSLPHNRRDVNGKCDFEKVEGMDGMYIANFINNPVYRDLDDMTEDPPAAVIRTVITFDKGAVWGYLRPPTTDSLGYDTHCTAEDCSLHLHGITDEWGPFYSTKNALGLMMATGNTGTHLTTNRDDINTYFSRDAGLTWSEVAKGSHIYEFGDHGGLIVMANDHSATDEILFSWNEGLTFHRYKFTDKKVEVDNIIIEPTARSLQFILYGSRYDGGERSGVLFTLDFSSLHERVCKGESTPEDASSDYETWSPSDGRLGGKCLMGQQLTYIRRKREAECFNPRTIDRLFSRSHCACTEFDYECDEGYARKLEGGPCLRTPDFKSDLNSSNADCPYGSEYKVTNGYRRVAGNVCMVKGGVDHDPTVFSCPHWLAKVSPGGHVSLLTLLILVVFLGGASYFKGGLPLPEFCLSYLDGLLLCFGRGRSSGGSGPTYGRIGELEPETAANYPTYGADEEDFGLDLDADNAQEATLLDDGFGSGSRNGASTSIPTSLPVKHSSAPIPAVRAPPSADAADDLLADFDDQPSTTADTENDFFGDSI